MRGKMNKEEGRRVVDKQYTARSKNIQDQTIYSIRDFHWPLNKLG